jgi:O-antigen ligase
MLIAKFKENRLVILTGALFILLASSHIPTFIYRHAFDKNTNVHLFLLGLISAFFGLYILLRPEKFQIGGKAIWLIWFIFIAEVISALLSSSPIASFVGETGRYVGVLSLICLLLVSTFHAQFNWESMRKLLWFYVLGAQLVALWGILQHFKLLTFPGDLGITSTLGNLDFYGAFVGTALPILFILAIGSTRQEKIVIAVAGLLSNYGIFLAGRRQAFVDTALLIFAILIFFFRQRIPRRQLSQNARTGFLTLGFFIWIEGIFLMPFYGSFVPLLGNDIQVKIRSDFWVAALNQFFSHPLFGVGPDQYGYYYERYRTLGSVEKYPTLLSNDAHGANVQTLATTGIVGTLAFALLIALLLRSLIILWDRNPRLRKVYFAFGTYFFIFLTNSAISPITLPNKYLFWALAGFIVGSAYRDLFGFSYGEDATEAEREEEVAAEAKERQTTSLALRIFAGASAAIILFVTANFGMAQIAFLNANEKHSIDHKALIHYLPSFYLPCTGYFDNSAAIVQSQGNQGLFDVAVAELGAHPRCVNARLVLLQIDWINNDMSGVGVQVRALEDQAPYRLEFLKMAANYAARVGDQLLAHKIYVQMQKVGFITVIHTGKAATSNTTATTAVTK